MKQLVLITGDKVGLLARIARTLAKSKVNIESISGEASGKKAIIRLVVSNDVRATEVLKKAGYDVLPSNVLVIKLENKHGALATLAEKLAKARISIENVHLVHKGAHEGIFALKTDNHDKAARLLKKWL